MKVWKEGTEGEIAVMTGYDDKPIVERTKHQPGEKRYWSTFGASDIPDDIQDELQSLGDRDTDGAWRTGEIVIEMFKWADAEKIEIPKMRMYAAVAVWRKKSAETVRTYHYVASKCPRKVYMDAGYQMLGFAQFKALVPLCGTDANKYHSYLQRWLDYTAGPHSPAVTSVDGIRGWLAGEKGLPPPALSRHRRVMIAAERMVSDASVPQALRMYYRGFLRGIAATIDRYGLEEWSI